MSFSQRDSLCVLCAIRCDLCGYAFKFHHKGLKGSHEGHKGDLIKILN